MEDPVAVEQAKAIATLLPTIMRKLFAVEDDPTCELPLAQLRVCHILEQGARSMSSLSQELGVSLSALTQIADRLERAGLVYRVPEANDRRIRCLQLTPVGNQMMQLKAEKQVARVLAVLERVPAQIRRDIGPALEGLLNACLVFQGDGTAV